MKKAIAVSALAAAALAACGGGGDDSPSVTERVPPVASQTPGGFINYLMALVKADATGLEPVDVSAVTPPKDDTSEPTVVD